MSCIDWQIRLEAYVDAELSQQEREEFLAHAAQCPNCATATLALAEAKRAIRCAGQRYTAPPQLRVRALESIRGTGETHSGVVQRPVGKLLPWPRWAMAAAALVLFTA